MAPHEDGMHSYITIKFPLYDTKGKAYAVCGMSTDITARKHAEVSLRLAYQDLKDTQAQLVQSGKLASIGELASGMAHELNQPLMVIRSNAQLVNRSLRKNRFDPDKLIQRLEPIERNTKRMMNIINHLRTFSRQSQTEFQLVDVNIIIDESFLMVGEQLRLHNIEVKKELMHGLPRVQGDANQLEQVVLNLTTNARDALVMRDDGRETKNDSIQNLNEFKGRIEISTRLQNSQPATRNSYILSSKSWSGTTAAALRRIKLIRSSILFLPPKRWAREQVWDFPSAMGLSRIIKGRLGWRKPVRKERRLR